MIGVFRPICPAMHCALWSWNAVKHAPLPGAAMRGRKVMGGKGELSVPLAYTMFNCRAKSLGQQTAFRTAAEGRLSLGSRFSHPTLILTFQLCSVLLRKLRVAAGGVGIHF